MIKVLGLLFLFLFNSICFADGIYFWGFKSFGEFNADGITAVTANITNIINTNITSTTANFEQVLVGTDNALAGNDISLEKDKVGSLRISIINNNDAGIAQVEASNDEGYDIAIGIGGSGLAIGDFDINSGALLNNSPAPLNIIQASNNDINFYIGNRANPNLFDVEKSVTFTSSFNVVVGTNNALSSVIIGPDVGIVLSGNATCWDDLRFPATQAKLNPVTFKPEFDFTNIGLLFPENDESEIAYFVAQMSHRYKHNSSIFPHIHYVQDEVGTPNFVMGYRWYEIAGDPTIAFTIVTTNAAETDYSSGSIHQILNFPAIASPSFPTSDISSILDIFLYRETGDGINGDVLVKEFDIHYEVNSLGSRTLSEK